MRVRHPIFPAPGHGGSVPGWLAALFLAAALLLPTSCSMMKKEAKVKADDVEEEAVEEANVKGEEKENRFFKKTLKAADVTSEPIAQEVVTTNELPLDSVRQFDSSEVEGKDKGGAAPKAKPEIPFYEKFLQGREDKPIKFQLNTDTLSLSDVILYFSNPEILDFNYVIDPRISAKKDAGLVVMNIDTELTPREIWRLFEQFLWLSGAYCSPGQGRVLNIYPTALMPQERTVLSLQDPKANVEVKMIPLKNAPTKDVVDKLKPFMTEGAQLIEVPSQNGLFIIESPANMGKLESLIEMLDKKNKSGWPEIILTCSNINASNIKDELAAILPILGFPVTVDNVVGEPGAMHLTANDRLQVIVATAANQEALNELKKWISILDRSDIGEQERVFVYKVVNGKASELFDSISAIFNTEGTSKGASTPVGTSKPPSTSGTPTKTDSKNPQQNQPQPAPQLQQPKTSSKTTAAKGKGEEKSTSIFDVPMKIFADDQHNRLVVRTTPRVYAMVKALLNRLDTVPAQVLLQVMIAEVLLDDNTQFGLEFSTQVKYSDAQSIYGTNFRELNPGGKEEHGFRYWVQNTNDPENKFAYIRALAGTGNTKVLSSPQVIAVSHIPAYISVGDKVPILKSQYTNTSSAGESQNMIEYTDTGIQLNITPHVTEGGLIVIELDQVVSDAVKTTTSKIDSPTIQERKVKTSLAIRDGGTLIVGGIIWERQLINQSSVPIISKIPILAALGYNDIQKKRIELLVMITGTIVTEKTDLEEMTRRYEEAMRVLKEQK